MVNNKRSEHVIDIRFTWSGDKAKEFIGIVKEEYGVPLPYGSIGQLIRLACIKYANSRREEK